MADEVSQDRAALTGSNARHLAQVLRVKIGQDFEIAGEGRVRLGTVSSVAGDRVEFTLGDEIESKQTVPITLVVAISKFDRFEWAIEKATELGVTRIMPVVARRTEAHLAQSAAKRVERWRRIAHEVSQQSRRVSPPEIADPMKLKDALGLEAALKILCAETEEGAMLCDAFNSKPASVALAIGPEGGWTEEEVQAFQKAGWKPVSLGATILRVETAVVAACAITGAMLE